MIYVEPQHLEIISNILKQSPVDFYAFGSRVHGTHKQFSDLDLCYKEPIASNIINKIEADFIESDLPFKVDIVDYQNCSDGFKNIINRDGVNWSRDSDAARLLE